MGKSLFRSRKERLTQSDLSEYIRPITDEERGQLQQVLFDMYKDLLLVCDKYELVPYLCGGSALGAIRHQGFIPWDDDLDIAMTRSDYNKLVKVFQRELGAAYILNAPNYSTNAKARFPKIIKKGTIFREVGTVKEPELEGVFLDIFVIDNVPNNKFVCTVKGIICNAEEYISGCVYDYENLDDVAKKYHKQSGHILFIIRMTIGRIFSIIPSSNWFHAIDKTLRWRDDSSKDCTLGQGRYHYFGEILPRDVIFPPRYCDFCGIEAPVFHQVEYYLENMYGDYMQIPPMEKRESHHIINLQL